jgi:signal transduction histidine kinase
LLRVMSRVHAAQGLQVTGGEVDATLHFAGEAQDLHEILGNVLDNAFKWARQQVQVSVKTVAGAPGTRLCIVIEDDGPGIDAARRETVMARGVRLDESVPGSGLGLAIVGELVGLYGGRVTLGSAALGGLWVELLLPAAPCCAGKHRARRLIRQPLRPIRPLKPLPPRPAAGAPGLPR